MTQPQNGGLVATLKNPVTFLKSLIGLILLSLSLSPLRLNAAHVKFFDVTIMSFAVLLLVWSAFVWWPSRKAPEGKGVVSHRLRILRLLRLLLIMSPFIFTLLDVIGDFAARELSIYEISVEQMRSSPVAQIFGGRITIGWPIDLTGEASSDSGHAELSIPVAGATRKANLHLNGVKANGVWSVEELYLVEVGSSAQIPVDTSTLPAR
jgi:hypothetical protein